MSIGLKTLDNATGSLLSGGFVKLTTIIKTAGYVERNAAARVQD